MSRGAGPRRGPLRCEGGRVEIIREKYLPSYGCPDVLKVLRWTSEHPGLSGRYYTLTPEVRNPRLNDSIHGAGGVAATWHRDGDVKHIVVWANRAGTEIQTEDGRVITDTDGRIMLLDNHTEKHRMPERIPPKLRWFLRLVLYTREELQPKDYLCDQARMITAGLDPGLWPVYDPRVADPADKGWYRPLP